MEEDFVENSDEDGCSNPVPFVAEHFLQSGPNMQQQKKKKWDKHHSCLFCEKKVIKMSAHLEKAHSNEPQVVNVLLLPKGSSVRRKAWGDLLNQGDFQHNVQMLREGKVGEIIPKYRSEKRPLDECVACCFCKGMYSRSLLAVHTKTCPQNHSGEQSRRGQSLQEGRLMMPVPSHISELFYRNVLQNMKRDDIFKVIQHDSLILRLGERLYSRRDLEEHTSGHISGRLRELGRLVECIRQRSKMKVSNLTAASHVKHFDTLLAGVK